jgi:hypothetical protein
MEIDTDNHAWAKKFNPVTSQKDVNENGKRKRV